MGMCSSVLETLTRFSTPNLTPNPKFHTLFQTGTNAPRAPLPPGYRPRPQSFIEGENAPVIITRRGRRRVLHKRSLPLSVPGCQDYFHMGDNIFVSTLLHTLNCLFLYPQLLQKAHRLRTRMGLCCCRHACVLVISPTRLKM